MRGRRAVPAWVALACAAVAAACATPASASDIAFTPVTVPNGPLQLNAILTRPAGHGRFPAVVLLHGCSGMWSTRSASRPQSHIARWLKRLPSHGFVAVAVDSFKPRGIARVCKQPPSKTGVSEVTDRATDAFAALSYLRTLPYVDPDRVAVLGWSNGGSTALATVGQNAPVAPPARGGFKSAVAFYPGCGLRSAFHPFRPTVPTRVFGATLDPLVRGCRTLARHAGSQVKLTVYRGAHHSFDESSARTRADHRARLQADRAALAALTTALARRASAGDVFSPDSWIEAPLPPDAPLTQDQSPAVALAAQARQFGTSVNNIEWSSPVYTVGPDQPRVPISVDARHTPYAQPQISELTSDLSSVPLPDDAQPSGPPESSTVSWSDHELIVYQPSSDTVWELYHLVRDGSRWTVTDGGRISNASRSTGVFDPWPSGVAHGMSASGIPLLAGLQRIDELQRGSIDHVVAIAVPHVRQGVFSPPATRGDGNFATSDAVPEGTVFRLPADVDVDALPLTPYGKIVAHAVQDHGMVVVDRDCTPQWTTKCPAVTFFDEEPRPAPDQSHADPYGAIFGGVSPGKVLDGFPWDRLQVVAED